jgi:hypothetical protein
MAAAFHRFETPDLKDNTVRVGKSMPMRSLHRHTIGRSSDGLMALTAEYVFLFLGLLFLSFFFNNCRGFLIAPFFRRLAKNINGVRIYGNHLKLPLPIKGAA